MAVGDQSWSHAIAHPEFGTRDGERQTGRKERGDGELPVVKQGRLHPA